MDWPSHWAADENTFIARDIHLNLARDVRILKAAHQFKFYKRPWPKGLFYLWDQFRIYAGLLWEPPIWHLRGEQTSRTASDDGGASSSSNDILIEAEETFDRHDRRHKSLPSRAPHSAYGQSPIVVGSQEEIRELILRAKDEQTEKRLRFANDITASIRVFLSEYVFDNNLHLAPGNLEALPHLLYFFFRFLNHSNVLTELDDIQDLRNALRVISVARKELLLTRKLRQIIPDNWSTACEKTWGSKAKSIFGGDPSVPLQVCQRYVGSKRWAEGDDEDGKHAVINRDSARHKRRKINDDDDVEMAEDVVVIVSQNPALSLVEGFSDSDPNNVDWTAGQAVHSPFSFLGPTTLPLTHSIGIVEQSVRKISAVMPPEPDYQGRGAEAELYRRLARVVMSPWEQSLDEKGKFGPRILSTSRGRIASPPCDTASMDFDDLDGQRPAHDPTHGSILLFIDPVQFKTYQECIGMSVSATWVQIVRLVGRGKGCEETAWYMEYMTDILPSFYLQSVPIDMLQ